MFQTSLTLNNSIALFGVMLILAVLPSVSVMLVTARTVSHGFIHGLYTTVGIIVGDILFILLAVLGLAFLADIMGELFVLIKYLGGSYLICLGILMWLSKKDTSSENNETDASALSSFFSGLFITLGDQKAILFYLGFLPAFMNFSAIQYPDILLIMLIATLAISIAKLSYAYVACKSRLLMNSRTSRTLNIIAGCLMLLVGLFLIFK